MSFTRFSVDGLNTYVDTVPNMKNIDVQLVVMVGSVDEPDELAGICHALEHCTHLQTPSFNGQPAIDSFADSHSFYRNANTYYTRTNYYTKGLALEPMLKLIGELTTRARFDAARVAEELKSVRREAKTSLDDIHGLNFSFQDYVLFGSPYGREIAGYHDRLDFSVDTLRQFYEDYYTVPNMTLIVVGDISPGEVKTLARRYITAFARTSSATRAKIPAPARPYPERRAFGFVREDSTNVRLCLQLEAPLEYIQADDESEWAYAAARSILSKAVIDELRYAQGLTYDGSFGLWSYNHRSASRFRIDATVDAADMNAALATMRSVLARPADAYGAKQFEEALAKQRMNAAEDVDNILGRADLYVNALSYGSPVVSVEDSFKVLERTTIKDVRRALEHTLQIWQAGDIVECVTGPRAAIGDRFIIEQSVFA